MSTDKKEPLTLSKLQKQVDDKYKILSSLHYDNERLINQNVKNIIELVTTNKKESDDNFRKCCKLIISGCVVFSVVLISLELIKYII